MFYLSYRAIVIIWHCALPMMAELARRVGKRRVNLMASRAVSEVQVAFNADLLVLSRYRLTLTMPAAPTFPQAYATDFSPTAAVYAGDLKERNIVVYRGHSVGLSTQCVVHS